MGNSFPVLFILVGVVVGPVGLWVELDPDRVIAIIGVGPLLQAIRA
jgi:hypothetical protein